MELYLQLKRGIVQLLRRSAATAEAADRPRRWCRRLFRRHRLQALRRLWLLLRGWGLVDARCSGSRLLGLGVLRQLHHVRQLDVRTRICISLLHLPYQTHLHPFVKLTIEIAYTHGDDAAMRISRIAELRFRGTCMSSSIRLPAIDARLVASGGWL